MFKLPELGYSFDALEPHIDGLTMEIHHDKHHGAYVEKLNDALKGHDDLLKMDIVELITNLSKVPENIRTTVRNNGGGHANHSFFWTIMSPDGGGEPSGEFAVSLNKAFGSLGDFKGKFKEIALSRFGSGWAWLCYHHGKLHLCSTPNQDSAVMEDKSHAPLLGLDVWEHAYYLKYQNRRADYVDAWWNVVNWKQVEKYFGMLTAG
ncbi:superoxide dismutase [Candidatus Saccharibacteria bacterium RIFCSPHIGHO2_12_FULL_49_19]|nr:MAG: superoxide dismutase [Candidatus Saccharibacteria bacterium RIFCSPHIGHO2_01_FULL_49_21]OGL36431.1 MAG: superoxide dismutase [Candidatus Saccharibacteria bacterium RIFCSPHIGHO2_12_FULL_49_19]OGL37941.1 MAG: superoxide dismutase [Candidatus Saccharibacteria bacterium RIFCSPLOWO2_01_FULL_49_22]